VAALVLAVSLVVALPAAVSAHTLSELPAPAEAPAESEAEGDAAPLDFDVTEGLEDLTPEEVEGHELGAQPPLTLSFGDLLDDDGLFEWEDAAGKTSLALLGSQAATTFDGGADMDASTLAGLASSAAVSYVPPHDGRSNDTSTIAQAQQQADNWFVSDTGQLFLPVGGVLVMFEPGTSEADINAIWTQHVIAPDRVSPVPGLPGAFSIDTSSDTESLRLVRLLADVPGVVSVTPNLFTPNTVDGSESVPQNYPSINTDSTNLCKSDSPPLSDALSKCLWHLDASEAASVSSGMASRSMPVSATESTAS